ncbi:MAG: hypothetical protein JSR46_05275, partial [Verrucomicrobia bacterium]|nr:hypothetical protein [Verrucomicrobiota bacterium]
MSLNNSTLDRLPLELWGVISQSLDVTDYKNVRLVCTLFHSSTLTKHFQQGQQYVNEMTSRAIKKIFYEEKECIHTQCRTMHWSGKIPLTVVIGVTFGVHYLLQSHRLDKICVWAHERLEDEKSIQNGMDNLTDELKNAVSSLSIDCLDFLGKKRCTVFRSFPHLQEVRIARAVLTEAFFTAIG